MRTGGKSGLTLMEMMVALGLIAVITLFVIGTLVRLLSTGGKSAYQTAASLLAQELLDSSIAAGPPRWGFSSDARDQWRGQRQLMLPGQGRQARFDYQVTVLPLRRSPEDLGNLHQVSVTVWWTGEQPGGRAEQGQTSVTSSRTVYVRGELGP